MRQASVDSTFSLGERVLVLRRRRNWTQQQLAARTDLSFSTVTALEGGRISDLCGGNLLRLAQVFGVTVDFLLGVKADKPEVEPLEMVAV